MYGVWLANKLEMSKYGEDPSAYRNRVELWRRLRVAWLGFLRSSSRFLRPARACTRCRRCLVPSFREIEGYVQVYRRHNHFYYLHQLTIRLRRRCCRCWNFSLYIEMHILYIRWLMMSILQ